jgi:hypothetical protein
VRITFSKTVLRILGLLLLVGPVAAQESPPSQQRIEAVLETLQQLNSAAEVASQTNPDASSIRPRGAPQTPIPPELLDELANASTEFLERYARERVLYGEDDRRNYGDLKTTKEERRAADAIAVFVRSSEVTPDGKGTFSMTSGKIGYCAPHQLTRGQPPERFYDEPTPGFCSGFKIGPDLMATAGHCIKTAAQCATTRIVFGFRKEEGKEAPEKDISGSDIYKCSEIIAGELNSATGDDWRIIRVDREISAPQVTLRTASAGYSPLGTKLTVIGHPSGMPIKIADEAIVRRHEGSVFVADLDTYGGNSGSPVFNSERLKDGELLVEGILVRGEDDFVQTTPCLRSRRCPRFSQCRGEDVTYASKLEQILARVTEK